MKKLTKQAGEVAGPGVPDGTGPYSGTPQCQMCDQEDDQEDDKKDEKKDDKKDGEEKVCLKDFTTEELVQELAGREDASVQEVPAAGLGRGMGFGPAGLGRGMGPGGGMGVCMMQPEEVQQLLQQLSSLADNLDKQGNKEAADTVDKILKGNIRRIKASQIQ